MKTKITPTQIDIIKEDINNALKEVENKYNIKINLGSDRYSNTEFKCEMKVSVVGEDGNRIIPQRELLLALREADSSEIEFENANPIGNAYSIRGEIVKIIGYDSGSPKNCWKILVEGRENKKYKCPSNYIKLGKLIK